MLRRHTAYPLLCWYLAACMSWHVQAGVTPAELIATRHPVAVRVTLGDSSQFILHQPRMAAGDSLVGRTHGAAHGVAVSDVTQVAIQRVNPGRSFVAVIGGLLLMAAVSCAGASEHNYVC